MCQVRPRAVVGLRYDLVSEHAALLHAVVALVSLTLDLSHADSSRHASFQRDYDSNGLQHGRHLQERLEGGVSSKNRPSSEPRVDNSTTKKPESKSKFKKNFIDVPGTARDEISCKVEP